MQANTPAGTSLRVTLTQWNVAPEISTNLRTALDIIAGAAPDRPDLILLPENGLFIGTNDTMRAAAFTLDSPEIEQLRSATRAASTTVVLGGFKRRAADGRVHNTALVIGPSGDIVGHYDKIHLFNAVVAGQSFEASRVEQEGDQPTILMIGGVKIGLTICYDMRFPELFRSLALSGVSIFLVPSAFTYVTGQAHWEILLRARAIESAAYVVASATVFDTAGRTEPVKTWGHALAVDPWGKVLADLGTAQRAWQTLDLDVSRAHEVRKSLPVLNNVRLENCRRPPVVLQVETVRAESEGLRR